MNDKSNRDWIEDLRSAVAEAQALLETHAAEGGDLAKQVHERVTDSLDRARSLLHEFEDDANRYVRDNPWQSLGIAAALGLVIGMLVTRRR
jgi:ElaB/YqjD/DUF883 family membrane-anchored ribosome-binding protein